MSQSLNHDIDNEFPPVDDNLITPTVKPADNSQVKDEELFGKTPIMGELPELHASFDLSQRNLDTTTDVLDMHKAVSLSGGVSVEDAQAIDAIAPGFINDDQPAGYFTQDKSKTMYNETLLSLNEILDNQLQQLNSTTADLAKQVIASGNRALERLKTAEVANLVRFNKSILALLMATGNDSVDCVRLILNNKTRWREFANLDLWQVMQEYPIKKTEGAICGQDDLDVPFKGTMVEEYVRKVCDSLRGTAGRVRHNLEVICSGNSDEISTGRGRFRCAEGDKSVFVEHKSNGDEVCSRYANITVVNLVAGLGSNTLRNWLANVNNSIIAEVQAATEILEKTAKIERSEDNNLDTDVKAAADLATRLHLAYANILGFVNSACDVLEVYCATVCLIDKVTEMQ